MNRLEFKKWVHKERELKACLEYLSAAKEMGFSEDPITAGTRLLIQEVIYLRGQIEDSESTHEELTAIYESMKLRAA